MVRLIAIVLALASVASPVFASGGPTIKHVDIEFVGSEPGPSYTVTVKSRVRVCATQGPVTLEVRERQTGFDHPTTVVAEHARSFSRVQDKPCKLYTPSWQLRDESFGAGIYKVRVKAVDRDGERSRGVSDRIETGD